MPSPSPYHRPPPIDHEMPFIEHLRELRKRLMISMAALAVGFIIGLVFYQQYVDLIIAPFDMKLKALGPAESFLMMVRISGYAGFALSFPVHVYNVVAFILPALNPRERRLLKWLLAGSLLLVLAGFYIGWYQILPYSIKFLKSQSPDLVENDFRFSEAIAFCFQMMIAFLVLFQTPLVMVILMAGNVVSRRQFLRIGRYVIVLIFFASAILTPPDIISQIGLAVPLIFLYYLAILVAKILGFGASDPDLETEDDE